MIYLIVGWCTTRLESACYNYICFLFGNNFGCGFRTHSPTPVVSMSLCRIKEILDCRWKNNTCSKFGIGKYDYEEKVEKGGHCFQFSSLCCWDGPKNPIAMVQHIGIYLIVGWHILWVESACLNERWDVFAGWVTIMGVDWEPTLRHACASRAKRG
jgi:hypothetical protein